MSTIPRCGCQDACSCLIQAGPGVTVQGIGTVERPYEIGAEGADLAGRIVFEDTPTVDFSTAGLGTFDDPYRISAETLTKMTDLADVADTPLNGESPVWAVDHWVFQTITGGGGSSNPEVVVATALPGVTTGLLLWVDTDDNTVQPGTQLVQSGTATVVLTTANTPTSVHVTFTTPFAATPIVVACASTTVPGTGVTGCSVSNITTTGFDLWVTRTNTTATGALWIAVGTAA